MTRLRTAAVAGLALVAVLALLAAGSRLADPFGWRASRLQAAETAAAAARQAAAARELELEGERAMAHRTAEAGRINLQTRVATAEVATQARSAPDASIPLDPARAARLRAHDLRLCQLAPAACAAAAADGAGRGPGGVPPADPA